MDVEVLFVGDFFQHTFDTSRDGNIQKELHNNYEAYLCKFKDAGYIIDLDILSHSYRCSPTVCRFVVSVRRRQVLISNDFCLS